MHIHVLRVTQATWDFADPISFILFRLPSVFELDVNSYQGVSVVKLTADDKSVARLLQQRQNKTLTLTKLGGGKQVDRSARSWLSGWGWGWGRGKDGAGASLSEAYM